MGSSFRAGRVDQYEARAARAHPRFRTLLAGSRSTLGRARVRRPDRSLRILGVALADKIRLWVEKLRGSYWPVPTVLLLMGGGLAYVATWVDRSFSELRLEWLGWFFAASPEGAHALLSAIASSVLGVAGTTFTITIAVLTLTSQQYGPRLLRSFLQDTRNQVVLGVFIGTFLYALLVMGIVRSAEDSAYVPRLAVAFALVLAVVNAFMLVYFIQHVVASIQVGHIVATVGDEMLSVIDRMCPQVDGEFEGVHDTARGPEGVTSPIPTAVLPGAASIQAGKSGYLQAIDPERIVKHATEDDVRVDLVRTLGEYVTELTTLARVTPHDRVTDELRRSVNESVIVGEDPTPAQDLAYGPRQLAEIAVRALSPSLNDPGTAIMCLDRLTAGLVLLVRRDMPPDEYADDEGCVRLTARRASIERILDASLGQIRRYGAGDIEVLSRMLRLLADVGAAARSPRQREALQENARLVLAEGLRELQSEGDRSRLQREFDLLAEVVGRRAAYGRAIPSATVT